jgi:hypothetical protein
LKKLGVTGFLRGAPVAAVVAVPFGMDERLSHYPRLSRLKHGNNQRDLRSVGELLIRTWHYLTSDTEEAGCVSGNATRTGSIIRRPPR